MADSMLFNIARVDDGQKLVVVKDIAQTVSVSSELLVESAIQHQKATIMFYSTLSGIAIAKNPETVCDETFFVKSDLPNGRSPDAIDTFLTSLILLLENSENSENSEISEKCECRKVDLGTLSGVSAAWDAAAAPIRSFLREDDNDNVLLMHRETMSNPEAYVGSNFCIKPFRLNDGGCVSKYTLFKYADSEVEFFKQNNLNGCIIHIIFVGEPHELREEMESFIRSLPLHAKDRNDMRYALDLLGSRFFLNGCENRHWRYFIQEPGTQVHITHPHCSLSIGSLVTGYSDFLAPTTIADAYQREAAYRSIIRSAAMLLDAVSARRIVDKVSARHSPMVYNLLAQLVEEDGHRPVVGEIMNSGVHTWSASVWLMETYLNSANSKALVGQDYTVALSSVQRESCVLCGTGIEVGYITTPRGSICMECGNDSCVKQRFNCATRELAPDGVNFLRKLYLKPAELEPDAMEFMNDKIEDLSAAEKRIHDLEAEARLLKIESDKLQKTLETKTAEIEYLNTEVANKDRDLKTAEKRVSDLESNASRRVSADEELQEKAAQIDNLVARAAQKDAELKAAEKKIGDLEAESARHKVASEEAQKTLQEKAAQIDNLVARAAQKDAELKGAEKKISDLEAELARHKVASEVAQKTLQEKATEIDNLLARAAQKDAELTGAEKKISDLEAETARHKVASEVAQKTLQEKATEIDNLLARAAQKDAELKAAEKKIGDLEAEAGCTGASEEVQKKTAEIQYLADEIAKREDGLKAAETKIDELKANAKKLLELLQNYQAAVESLTASSLPSSAR